jgi:hypothetical protein
VGYLDVWAVVSNDCHGWAADLLFMREENLKASSEKDRSMSIEEQRNDDPRHIDNNVHILRQGSKS